MLRSLVDQVTLVPDGGELAIVLRGDLGAILRFTARKQNPDLQMDAEALDNLMGRAAADRRPGRSGGDSCHLGGQQKARLWGGPIAI